MIETGTTVAHRGSEPPLVYIVDDDTVATEIIGRTLAQVGFRTRVASDKQQALRGIREHAPDLILLDISLPDGSGLDVCREMRLLPGLSQVPVVFISAHEDIATKVEAFEAGAVDYISKPLAGAEVIARVRTHLRLKQAYETVCRLQAERIQKLGLTQESFMPQAANMREARFEVEVKQAYEAGGDFYDVIRVGENLIDYVVADASGHDLAASYWTIALKTLLNEYSSALNTPAEIIHFINNSLLTLIPEGIFFTLIHARLNRASGELSLVNAAHPPAILLRRQSGIASIIRQDADVLGAFRDAAFNCTSLTVFPGDRLFFYSDGLIETQADREVGVQTLVELLQKCRNLPMDKVVRQVVSDMPTGGSCEDDVVLMGIDV